MWNERRGGLDVVSEFPLALVVLQRANLPEPAPDAVVCHNDLCVENVGTRDGRAVAFIDFDFAARTDPLVDIAIAARHWVPVRDPHDMNDGRSGVDQIRRLRLFCDAHGQRRGQPWLMNVWRSLTARSFR